VPDKQTTTESPPSDTLVGILFGSAAVLVLAGAFYARITKITLPGGAGIELAALSSDLDNIQKTVPEKVSQRIDELPERQKQALGAADIARISSVASIGAQRELLQLRAAAKGAPVTSSDTLPMADLARARGGMPLSDELIGRLVEKAVGDAVRTSAADPPRSTNG
jgi:hypothetical protein